MQRSINWKKVLLISWAILLTFGLSFQASQAEALHGPCADECAANCEDCALYHQWGCKCFWRCEEGGGGSSTCALL